MSEDVPRIVLGGSGSLGLVLSSAGVMAASGLVALLFPRHPRTADRVAAGMLSLGVVLGLGGIVLWSSAGSTPVITWPWALHLGSFSIAMDGLSACFLLPVLLIPGAAAIYGLGYWPQSRHGVTAPGLRVFLGLLAAAMEILVVARDGLLFLFAFEVITVCAFLLVTTENEREEVRQAGWIYFVASHVSLLFLFAAFALLRASTGTFDLTPAAAGASSPAVRTTIFALVLIGFGVKAGIVPLHVWLPGAHANAPSHVSAVLSGVVIKLGIYGLARITAILPDPPMIWGASLVLLGAISGVVGVAYALGQHDLKRLLAYHSIENIGIIVMGLGVALLGRWAQNPTFVVLGLACALMHVWNHGLFKTLLFLSAGSVIHAAGTREIDRLGGLARAMPWTAALFGVGAVAICGLPPFNGFVSEFFLYSSALRSCAHGTLGMAILTAPVLAIIGALASACFIKVIGCVFLGRPRTDDPGRAHECGWVMRSPMLFLALMCLLLGLLPILGVPLLDSAARAWAGESGLVLPSLRSEIPFDRLGWVLAGSLVFFVGAALGLAAIARRSSAARTVTWACGYVSPTARMQYSASSLANALVGVFRPVFHLVEHRPQVEGPFPRPSSFEAHVDDFALQRIALPFCNWASDRFSTLRRWQTGRIQTYVLYVILTMIGLMWFVIPIRELLGKLITE